MKTKILLLMALLLVNLTALSSKIPLYYIKKTPEGPQYMGKHKSKNIKFDFGKEFYKAERLKEATWTNVQYHPYFMDEKVGKTLGDYNIVLKKQTPQAVELTKEENDLFYPKRGRILVIPWDNERENSRKKLERSVQYNKNYYKNAQHREKNYDMVRFYVDDISGTGNQLIKTGKYKELGKVKPMMVKERRAAEMAMYKEIVKFVFQGDEKMINDPEIYTQPYITYVLKCYEDKNIIVSKAWLKRLQEESEILKKGIEISPQFLSVMHNYSVPPLQTIDINTTLSRHEEKHGKAETEAMRTEKWQKVEFILNLDAMKIQPPPESVPK